MPEDKNYELHVILIIIKDKLLIWNKGIYAYDALNSLALIVFYINSAENGDYVVAVKKTEKHYANIFK
jgi:hypothetical protein